MKAEVVAGATMKPFQKGKQIGSLRWKSIFVVAMNQDKQE